MDSEGQNRVNRNLYSGAPLFCFYFGFNPATAFYGQAFMLSLYL